MYEFMMAVHGRNRKMLLLDVVDIKKYSTKEKLILPLNLKDSCLLLKLLVAMGKLVCFQQKQNAGEREHPKFIAIAVFQNRGK